MGHLITINGHTIRRNAVHGSNEPPVRLARTKSGGGEYASEVAICDKDGVEVARLIYQPHNPIMSCGARLVLTTEYDAQVIR